MQGWHFAALAFMGALLGPVLADILVYVLT